jgi:hypothetical protein
MTVVGNEHSVQPRVTVVAERRQHLHEHAERGRTEDHSLLALVCREPVVEELRSLLAPVATPVTGRSAGRVAVEAGEDVQGVGTGHVAIDPENAPTHRLDSFRAAHERCSITTMNRTRLRSTSRVVIALASATVLVAVTAGTASAGQDLCISTNGVVRVQKGTATCSSWPGAGNVAIARGAQSSAIAGVQAGDTHNRAVANGANSQAFSGQGSNNTSTASGDDSFAEAAVGNGNTATANGSGTRATAWGTNQKAIASAEDADAVVRNGVNSVAIASGYNSFANANGGSGNIATASGANSSAIAVTGVHNRAFATADQSSASVESGDNNTAIANTPGCTISAAGEGQTVTC